VGFLGNLGRWFKIKPANPATVLPRGFGDEFGPGFATLNYSDAGETVTPETAMAASAVFACVSIISDALAPLPIRIQNESDKSENRSHPLHKLLNKSPNDHMGAADFRQALFANLLLYGNAFAAIERGRDGAPAALYPLRSADTEILRGSSGNLFYRTKQNARPFTFNAEDVMHLRGLSYDGVRGLSPIGLAANSIGLALALERYGCRFFSNGAQPGGILELPRGMSKPAIKEFVDDWKNRNAGPENAFKTALFTDGMKWHPSGIDPEKAQMIDTRVFQVREVARVYRVPLHMIGDLERSTYSNIEHQAIEFQQRTIQPWAVKFENEAERKLLSAADESLEVRMDLDALLRADTAARYASYNAGRQGGWLSVNDIRRREGLPPINGGDTYLSPLNMTPAGGVSPAAAKPAEGN
jgi:HK97 family phage portal protein